MRKVSIIIPIYNVEKYISDCIQSVCNQKIQDFELILVDDGSVDNSVQIATRLLVEAGKDYKLHYQKNAGQAAARNAGMRLATGEWIVCVDSDDVICPDFTGFVTDRDGEVCALNYKRVNDRTIFDNDTLASSDITYSRYEALIKFLQREIQFICPALFMKREFIEKNGLYYNETMRFSEDLEYIWRVLFSTDRIIYNVAPLYHYRLRPNSIMTSSSKANIISGYQGIKALSENLTRNGLYSDVVKYILPRWVLGTLHSAAKLLDWKSYQTLMNELDAPTNMRNISGFPDGKTRILSVLYNISPKLMYTVCRKV
jgi:glycosyltransferase involved in cell wall biosynthesis